MVSEMVEIFFFQYLANFETRGCGGDFSTQNLPPTHRFRDICIKRLILQGDGKKTGSVDCVECLVALIPTCFRSSNLTGKRRREMTGVSRVLGRLDSDVLSLEQCNWERTSAYDGCF